MKRMKMMAAALVAILMALTMTQAVAEKTHGGMIGKWVSMDKIGGESYACEYMFYEDGTYDYTDEAIHYQETGSYNLQENCLIITRADGGIEVYRLDTLDYTFFDAEEEDCQVFARTMPQNLAASISASQDY